MSICYGKGPHKRTFFELCVRLQLAPNCSGDGCNGKAGDNDGGGHQLNGSLCASLEGGESPLLESEPLCSETANPSYLKAASVLDPELSGDFLQLKLSDCSAAASPSGGHVYRGDLLCKHSEFTICSQATDGGLFSSCLFTPAKSQPGLFRAQQTLIIKNKSY